MNISKLTLLFLCLLITAQVDAQISTTPEFRGVWLATVKNIDWPPKDVSVSKQKKAFLKTLDFYESMNFNSMVVQVRTAGDALYVSEISPVSRFLTGEEGNYRGWKNEDPLQFMIEQTHLRGMDFHAWLNPYRATIDPDTSVLDKKHVFFDHPDWIIKYGKQYYMNPGLPEVRDHIDSIIFELINKYDIDGIHFDDYFYPYKIKDEFFNDTLSFQHHGSNFDDIGDWRRANVDSLVKNVSAIIDDTKPWVSFGISPFGIWRNKSQDDSGSDTQAAQTNYDDLYADPLKWIDHGWIDYVAPQIYWSMNFDIASYRVLLNWWESKAKNVNLYVGMGAYKVQNNSDPAWEDLNEIPNQVELNRSKSEVDGSIFFSAKSLMKKTELSERLRSNYYKEKALAYLPKEKNINLPKPKIERLKVRRKSFKGRTRGVPKGGVAIFIQQTENQEAKLFKVLRSDSYMKIDLSDYDKDIRISLVPMDEYHRMGVNTFEIDLIKKERKWIMK